MLYQLAVQEGTLCARVAATARKVPGSQGEENTSIPPPINLIGPEEALLLAR